MTRRLFAHGDACIAVQAASPAVLRWLADFVRPSFRVPARARRPLATVRLTVGPARLAARLSGAARTGRRVECFTMDRDRAPWPLWRRASDGSSFAYSSELGVLLEPRGPRGVDVVAARDGRGARLVLMRVLRELATADAQGRGVLLLHAAAVADASGVTVVVGPKKAGKTSFLVYGLGQPGARFIANDRALVDLAPARPSVAGMPTIVRLRQATLDMFPRLGAAVGARAWRFYRSDGEPAPGDADERPAAGAEPWPLGLRAVQLMELLGAGGSASGPLARLVLPRVPARPRRRAPFTLTRLSAPQAARRLRREGLLASGRAAGYLTGAPSRIPEAELRERLARLCSRVPCFACTLGPGAYDSAALWRALTAGG